MITLMVNCLVTMNESWPDHDSPVMVIKMEICAWNEFSEEVLTFWDINNYKKSTRTAKFLHRFAIMRESRLANYSWRIVVEKPTSSVQSPIRGIDNHTILKSRMVEDFSHQELMFGTSSLQCNLQLWFCTDKRFSQMKGPYVLQYLCKRSQSFIFRANKFATQYGHFQNPSKTIQIPFQSPPFWS